MLKDRVQDALSPPPEVRVCGKRVAPDPDPAELANGNGSHKNPFALGKGPSEIVNYPGTVLLLAINLGFAYHLWAKRVSDRGVCVCVWGGGLAKNAPWF